MQLGIQIYAFNWPGGPARVGPHLAAIARAADEAGCHSVWVMDHVFQIPMLGPAEDPMLEAYTTLAYLAGLTSRVRLGAMVTGVTYRHPGMLIKQVTALDVLSGGRAILGIGAAYYEREHAGLGIPFPPLKERLERLEEALQIAHQMWSDDDGPFAGKHYQLAETINQPASVSRPHPPIWVGGGGEQKTLRLVARYADACNFFGDPAEVRRKLGVLRDRCAEIGRDYDQIEKTAYLPGLEVGPGGSRAREAVDQLAAYAEAGIQTVIVGLPALEDLGPIEAIGRDVIPQIAGL